MRSDIAKHLCSFFLLGAVARSPAQSTWNYFLSDAGGGNSLVTWSVAGDLATQGVVVVNNQSALGATIHAPGIYVDSYAASGVPQPIPTPDGSSFQLEGPQVYSLIVSYAAYNAPNDSNDSFGLSASGRGLIGAQYRYSPGSQSAVVPIDFSNFNPGTYQSVESLFSTPLTVNLTIVAVPEPSTLALVAGGMSGLLIFRRRD
jgi:hypothetical protein